MFNRLEEFQKRYEPFQTISVKYKSKWMSLLKTNHAWITCKQNKRNQN